MRHRVRTRRLGVRTSHRKAMMRNMVTSLLEHGRIVTTITRAKELRRLADRMVTLGKDGSLHARRQALSVIRDRQVVAKLFDEWSPKFADRNGGYTRIVRLGPRRGDATMMAVIELAVESIKPGKKKQRKPEVASTAPESVIPAAAPETVSEAGDEGKATPETAEASDEAVETAAAAQTEEETAEVSVKAEEEEDTVAASEAASTETAEASAGSGSDETETDVSAETAPGESDESHEKSQGEAAPESASAVENDKK